MKEKITVLISDDNVEFANTLSSYLEKDEEIVIIGRAKDGEEAEAILLEDGEYIGEDVSMLYESRSSSNLYNAFSSGTGQNNPKSNIIRSTILCGKTF